MDNITDDCLIFCHKCRVWICFLCTIVLKVVASLRVREISLVDETNWKCPNGTRLKCKNGVKNTDSKANYPLEILCMGGNSINWRIGCSCFPWSFRLFFYAWSGNLTGFLPWLLRAISTACSRYPAMHCTWCFINDITWDVEIQHCVLHFIHFCTGILQYGTRSMFFFLFLFCLVNDVCFIKIWQAATPDSFSFHTLWITLYDYIISTLCIVMK